MGTNNLLKTGAALVTRPQDVFDLLGVHHSTVSAPALAYSETEAKIIRLLAKGMLDDDAIYEELGVPYEEFGFGLKLIGTFWSDLL